MSNFNDCLICDRIDDITNNKNPYFVRELKTGFVVLGDHQFFHGYTLFLCKKHKRELHELDPEFKKRYLWEMSIVAEAVFQAFGPVKLNYELLGNADHHMHWHLFPRHANDPLPNQTVWNINKEIRQADQYRPNKVMLDELKETLLTELEGVLQKTN